MIDASDKRAGWHSTGLADRQRAQRAVREAARLSRTGQPAHRRGARVLPAVSAR